MNKSNLRCVKIVVAILSLLCMVTPIYADSSHKYHLNDTKKSGDFKALDEKGNVISDVELFLKKRDSGWMYTSQSKTDPIKDGSVIIAKFYTRGKFSADSRKNIVDWGNGGSNIWVVSQTIGANAFLEERGSYKPAPNVARWTMGANAQDPVWGTGLYEYHTYWFYGDGTWAFESSVP